MAAGAGRDNHPAPVQEGSGAQHQEFRHRVVRARLCGVARAARATTGRSAAYQFLEDCEWIPIIGARYQMGVDGVAVLLILLTTLLGWIAVALFVEVHPEAREGVLRPAAAVADLRARRLLLRGPLPLLISSSRSRSCRCTSSSASGAASAGSTPPSSSSSTRWSARWSCCSALIKMYFLTQDAALMGAMAEATIDARRGEPRGAAN